MHGINLAAVNTKVRNPPDSLWTHALCSTGATRQLDYVFTDEVKADDVKDSGIIQALGGKSDHRGLFAEFTLTTHMPEKWNRRPRVHVGWEPLLDDMGEPAEYHRHLDELVAKFDDGAKTKLTEMVVQAAGQSGGRAPTGNDQGLICSSPG